MKAEILPKTDSARLVTDAKSILMKFHPIDNL